MLLTSKSVVNISYWIASIGVSECSGIIYGNYLRAQYHNIILRRFPMGIRFNATKEGKSYINLTEYSIKNIIFNSDKSIKLDPRINDVTNSIILEGIINFESIHEPRPPRLDEFGDQVVNSNNEPQFEDIEIDYVRKLANWAIIPEYLNCYCDLEYDITDSTGSLVKTSTYENLFIIDYWEMYDDELGHGKFYALIRERENGSPQDEE